ncbi:MAG TPA: hypothetical protein PLE45_03510 [Spirochaetota bacterium]|nr:hypothetical protein [Spirochaetota bacterium]HOL56296.1 hypothetical protein [Spirochaetota bacterium]HPP03686.1 hypothetical protein [Spirochaetota bacterium]
MEIKNENIKPEIIIDYFDRKDLDLPIIVIYVRPESNEVFYEKALLKGISPFGDIVYLANLNGKIFLNHALILDHYSTQYSFAIRGKDEIAKYPPMVKKFEKYFKVKFNDAKIIGSFDAILNLNIEAEELFNLIVDKKDFLSFYGHTIKKIEDLYIVNSNIPAILNKYTDKTNVFVMAARLRDEKYKIEDINCSIFEELKKDNKTTLIDEKFLKDIKWEEKIKRTYHISRNYIMATFDMIDFIFKPNGERIEFSETPLGRMILDENIMEKSELTKLKDNPLVYIKTKRGKKLINIAEYPKNMTMRECIELIKSIV